MFEPQALREWRGLDPHSDPASLHIAKWMAWLAGVSYADDFGDIDRPGYIFRQGFHRMGFGYDVAGNYSVSANGLAISEPYQDEGELWWKAGHRLKPLVAECPELPGGTNACALRNAIELDLFTQLPASRGIGKLHGQKLEGMGYFDAGTTQVFVLHEPTDGYAVVVFRGTQKEIRSDVLADITVGMKSVDGVMVHSGFHYALHEPTDTRDGRTAAELLIDRLEALPQGTQVFVAGHSLGGALATLFAWEAMRMRAPGSRSYTIRGVYTFGAPGVGDRYFADSLNEHLRREGAWLGRFVYGRDVVPALTGYLTWIVGGYRYVHNTGEDEGTPRHAQGINLACDGARYDITEWRPLIACDGPIADHDIRHYFGALRTLAANATGDDMFIPRE